MTAKHKKGKKSYRSVQEEFLVLLEEGLRTAGRVTKREFDRVSEAVRERLEKKYGKERVEQFQSRVQANWQETVDRIYSAKDRIKADDSFKKGRDVGVQILENLAATIRKAAENLEASFSDKVTYHSGQVVDRGVFLCNNCSKIQEVKRRRKLSVCSECGGSEFRQS
ncbi:zinc ribbon-containing protein [bacterium]|nr:zinc ribbon-containing protein [bacterium]